MRPYLALFSARFRLLLQYRAAAWAGVATQLFWGLIRCLIFEAFYHSTTSPQPMNLRETISYVWLGQALLIIVMFGVDADVREAIRTGAVAYELCRPADLWWYWFARGVAYRTGPLLLRAVPQFCVAVPFLGLALPPSPWAGLAFLAATAGAVALASAWVTLLTVTMLWTISGDGIARIGLILPMLFSGLIVPLPLLPDWMQAFVRWQPFGAMADLPFRLWIGHLPPCAMWAVLGQQLVWFVAFTVAGRALLAQATRRLVVQGG